MQSTSITLLTFVVGITTLSHITSCTGAGSFSAGGRRAKSTTPDQSRSPRPVREEASSESNNKLETAPSDPVHTDGSKNTPPPQPVETPKQPDPKIEPPKPEIVQPKINPEPTIGLPRSSETPTIPTPDGPRPDVSNGSVKFAVYGILNQDTQYQITNDNTRLQIRGSSGELLVSAPVDGYALLDGEAADSRGGDLLASAFVLNAKPEFIKPGLSGSFSGQIDVCLPQNPSAPFNQYAECANINPKGHSNGLNQIKNATANGEVSGNNVVVKTITGAGSYGHCSGTSTMPCVALGHPTIAYALNDGQTGRDYGSPLVLDFSGKDKLDLLSPWDDKKIIKFDLSGQGTPIRTGWIGRKAGLLVLDAEGSGAIKSGRQLFGEYSQPRNGESTKTIKTFDNGFLALAQYDDKKLGHIDSSNPIYGKLQVWFDRNFNGISEKGELRSLSELKVSRINLGYKVNSSNVLIKDNKATLISSYETADGKTHLIADVYFAVRVHRLLSEVLWLDK